MVTLEGFLWLSAGHFGGGERIGEEEREEVRLFSPHKWGLQGWKETATFAANF